MWEIPGAIVQMDQDKLDAVPRRTFEHVQILQLQRNIGDLWI